MSLLDSCLPKVSIWGEYNIEEKKIVDNWNKRLGDVSVTALRSEDFLEAFLEYIPKEEMDKYVLNSINYFYRKEFDPKYVLVTRRAVPSKDSKPEEYWTDNPATSFFGLRNELPLGSASRIHSVIMVTSLKALEDHGIVESDGAISDGEIKINNTPFDNFLFMYKPKNELKEFKEYDGITKEELLEELKGRKR